MPTIAIAGARGFVGQELVRRLSPSHHVIALSRYSLERQKNCEWRQCDMSSLEQIEMALSGATHAVYLVHSMMPSVTFTQAEFQDLDVFYADNFARVAAKIGIRKIIYLGGLLPESTTSLSPHLQSRYEVERVLQSYGVPCIVLRAGLIVGSNGSSYQIMKRLVEKLPLMVCPRWTQNLTQPIALVDIVSALISSIHDLPSVSNVYDCGSPTQLTYLAMLNEVSKQLRLKRFMIPVPFFSAGLSRLWVSLVAQAPRDLVKPLVQSLKHSMLVRPTHEFPGAKQFLTFSAALSQAIQDEVSQRRRVPTQPVAFLKSTLDDRTVCSMQRLRCPETYTAHDIGQEYVNWLSRRFAWILKTTNIKGEVIIRLRGFQLPLLVLQLSTHTMDANRSEFRITRGFLVAKTTDQLGLGGRFEFRKVLGKNICIAAINGYRPHLPWILYRFTQAMLHKYVMYCFGKHLNNLH